MFPSHSKFDTILSSSRATWGNASNPNNRAGQPASDNHGEASPAPNVRMEQYERDSNVRLRDQYQHRFLPPSQTVTPRVPNQVIQERDGQRWPIRPAPASNGNIDKTLRQFRCILPDLKWKWRNHSNVTVTFTCNDSLSARSCTPPAM